MTVRTRQLNGTPHSAKTKRFYEALSQLDFENGDFFEFKSGGEGDNGEHLMYLLDILFEKGDIET